MSGHTVDVVVVGAGPAGCSAAVHAARAGLETVVLDRAHFPRDKVCGDGLAPRAVAALRDMGVEPNLRSAGYRPFREYRVVSSWGEPVRAAVPAFGKGAGYAYVVPRRELDRILVDHARVAGAEVREGVRATGCATGVGGLPLVRAECMDTGEQLQLTARVVIAADGSRGSFSRRVIPPRHLQPSALGIRAYMDGVESPDRALGFFLDRCLLPGYGWVFPGGSDGAPANVGVGMLTSSLRRRPGGLRALFSWFLSPSSSAWPSLREARIVSPPAAFPLLLRFSQGRRRAGSMLVAGDAANLIDPLSGEGIAYALESGRAAAAAVAAARRSGRPGDLAQYQRAVWAELGAEFLGAYLLRRLLATPWGNGMVIRLLRRDEGLASGGIGLFSNSIPVTWLARPAVLARVLSPRRLVDAARGSRPAGV